MHARRRRASQVNCTQLATVSLSAWLGYIYFLVLNFFFDNACGIHHNLNYDDHRQRVNEYLFGN